MAVNGRKLSIWFSFVGNVVMCIILTAFSFYHMCILRPNCQQKDAISLKLGGEWERERWWRFWHWWMGMRGAMMLVTGEIKSANSYHEKAIDSMTTFYRIFFWFGLAWLWLWFWFLFCSLLTIRLFCRFFSSSVLRFGFIPILSASHIRDHIHTYNRRQRRHDSEDRKQASK